MVDPLSVIEPVCSSQRVHCDKQCIVTDSPPIALSRSEVLVLIYYCSQKELALPYVFSTLV